MYNLEEKEKLNTFKYWKKKLALDLWCLSFVQSFLFLSEGSMSSVDRFMLGRLFLRKTHVWQPVALYLCGMGAWSSTP